jgi:NAD(P)H dehydrogenase (quinone)
MLLITGATGHYGKATIDFLLKKGFPAGEIAALVRDEEKAAGLKTAGVDPRVGNYDDYDSLATAFKGVDKLLFVSGSDVANRVKQHENVVAAARQTGVKHVVYTSFERKNDTDTSPIAMIASAHLITEKSLKESGLDYTILRNNIYAEYIPVFIGDNVLNTGIFLPAGDGAGSFAVRADMAEATANILKENGHEDQEYFFSNTDSVSFHDIAAIIGSASGKAVAYVSPARDVYIDTLTKAGVPADYAHVFAGFAEGLKLGEFSPAKTDLEKLLGRKPVSVKEFLTGLYASAKS